MALLETPRLQLRELVEADAPFILELLNEPGWLRFIGDRGIRDAAAARGYIVDVVLTMYRENGFGLWAVQGRDGGDTLGLCGLIRRPGLADVDIGFAFLARHHGRGLAREAAAAVLDHARHVLALPRIVAITSLDNGASIRLLERVGLRFESIVTLPHSEEPLRLFATDWPDCADPSTPPAAPAGPAAGSSPR